MTRKLHKKHSKGYYHRGYAAVAYISVIVAVVLALLIAVSTVAALRAYGRNNADANGADAAANKTPAIVQAASLTVSVEKVRKDEIARRSPSPARFRHGRKPRSARRRAACN
jgi:hypothetical protein